MLRILYVIILLICLVTVGLILNLTTPSNAGPLGILILLVASYVILVLVFTYIIYHFNKLIARLSLVLISRKPVTTLSVKRSYYLSTVLSTIPIIFTGLQSVGSVGFYEVLLIVIFVTISCFYVLKRVE